MPPSKSEGRCAYPWQQMIIDLTGEVVPCCFWSGYGNKGRPLGNTNAESVEAIWNGPAWQDLRAAVRDGPQPGHPCHHCVAWQWGNGTYPRFTWPAGFSREQGHCFLGPLPERLRGPGQDSGVELLEDGIPLPWPASLHEDIRQSGMGRYSVWKGSLYFSASDNSDPILNGRRYVLRRGSEEIALGNLVRESASGANLLKAHEEYDSGATVMQAKPTMLSLISTADCNIDCPGCSQNVVRLARVQHRPETVPAVLELVPTLQQFIWHGGEPYLIKRFRDFIDGFDRSRNPNLTFGFTSNGTMLSATELDKLQRFPQINASISVDSFKRETFAHIRAGASYDMVIRNLLRAIARYDAPSFVMSCGMIVCKSNMLELPENLRFAIDHDIPLNLSPVLVYPLHERLDVFTSFERQTAGWREALQEARALVLQARARHAAAVMRIDPTGMLDELELVLQRAQERHAEVLRLRFQLLDPHRSLARMRRPALVITSDMTSEVHAYVALRPDMQTCEVEFPRGADAARAVLLHDLAEPSGSLMSIDLPAGCRSGRQTPTVQVRLPPFAGVERPRNGHLVNYGESTPEGVNPLHPQDIVDAYVARFEHELRPRWKSANATPSNALMWRLARRSGHAYHGFRAWLRNLGAGDADRTRPK